MGRRKIYETPEELKEAHRRRQRKYEQAKKERAERIFNNNNEDFRH